MLYLGLPDTVSIFFLLGVWSGIIVFVGSSWECSLGARVGTYRYIIANNVSNS